MCVCEWICMCVLVCECMCRNNNVNTIAYILIDNTHFSNKKEATMLWQQHLKSLMRQRPSQLSMKPFTLMYSKPVSLNEKYFK